MVTDTVRDYTNPYLPVAPSAMDGSGQVIHWKSLFCFLLFVIILSFVYLVTAWLSSIDYFWSGWSEARSWEQCSSGNNWKHAVCCNHRRSSHGISSFSQRFLFVDITLLLTSTQRLFLFSSLLTGIFCIWYCSKNCYFREELWISGPNPVPR